MAFRKRKSNKCPVCVVCTDDKIRQVDAALEPLLQEVRATGEVPKASDSKFDTASRAVGVAPNSLRYHLKECLLDLEIQDQRLQELVDMSDAVATAKDAYAKNPSMQNASALAGLMNVWRALASDIEGQQDPEQAVVFVAETVMGPLSKRTLAVVTEELRALRDGIGPSLAKGQSTYVDAQLKSALTRVSNALRDSLDESLKSVCGYYKVELEAKERRRTIESAAPIQNSSDAAKALLPVTPTSTEVH